MIQSLRISDALRCILLNGVNGPNMACPKEGMGRKASRENVNLCKRALTPSPDRITLGWWKGVNLGGLVSAHTRAGSRIWEVDRLYLHSLGSNRGSDLDTDTSWPPPVPELDSLELLESLVYQAGCKSAQRIFLRIPSGSPVAPVAQQCGFFPSFEETLFEGKNIAAASWGDPPIPNLRTRLIQDDYPLFQLFNAATPPSVRTAVALTFDQWQDSQEGRQENTRQWVVECDDRVTAWLSLPGSNRHGPAQMLVHPDHSGLVPGLINLALNSAGARSWLLPDYQDYLRHYLQHWGLQPVTNYTMLIKTVAVPVRSPGVAAVEA
jgi:hypothetical protein